ncbi:MAG: phosphohydrolase [Patescibacteria group bacterium]
MPHVVLVTQLALKIGRQLDLKVEQLQFIEEASMLHDIGICQVHAPAIGCTGDAPYIQHGILGKKILDSEGLPQHALVCERHSGVGITKEEIESENLQLPHRDFLPLSIEEEIICYSDVWYSKNPEKLWKQHTLEEVHQWFQRFPGADEKTKIFDDWHDQFGE